MSNVQCTNCVGCHLVAYHLSSVRPRLFVPESPGLFFPNLLLPWRNGVFDCRGKKRRKKGDHALIQFFWQLQKNGMGYGRRDGREKKRKRWNSAGEKKKKWKEMVVVVQGVGCSVVCSYLIACLFVCVSEQAVDHFLPV